MERVKEANGVLSLYLSYMDPESMTGVYIVDADSSENGCLTGVWDPIYPENREALTHPEDGFPAYITDTEEYGWLCSAGAAVLDGNGRAAAHVFVDISMDSAMADRQSYLMRLCGVLLACTALILGVNRVLVRPINSLASAAASYVADREHIGASALDRLRIHTGDEAEMFVTVWLGILEISTGRMICANAGHEYPALRRAGGAYALVKDQHGFVLAGMEHARYQEYKLVLRPGDELFVYTDGVAEATSAANKLFGTDRMLDALNSRPAAPPEELLRTVKERIDGFVGEAPQFDDITMLGLRYLGPLTGEGEAVC